MNQLAQIKLGTLKGPGDLGNPGSNAPDIFNSTISTIIGAISVVGFIWFIIQFLLGAIQIISAGGDKAQLETARKKITNSL